MSDLSLILPFYERHEATTRALKRHAELYPVLDLEVIIVDDGSALPYVAPAGLPWQVYVIHLPRKKGPLNPCLPINIGVHSSGGNVLAISNPEIVHTFPVLEHLAMTLSEDVDYVAAACWCPDNQRWHAHSTRTPLYADRTPIRMPENAQYHFLGVLTRDTWNACGGFDNEYRFGAGYDDNDFLLRLDQVGAKFAIRDDLIVEHSREGAHAPWTREMFERNRQLFIEKWG